ncbi:MAG: cupin domain-containing protein [Halobacteriaceae archaeon]
METATLEAGETAEVIDGVYLTQLAAGDRMSVQHFRYDPGAVVEAHSHHHEQVGYVIEGTVTFTVDGETRDVGEGGSYVAPSESTHAAANETDGVVSGIEVFSPPRLQPPWED